MPSPPIFRGRLPHPCSHASHPPTFNRHDLCIALTTKLPPGLGSSAPAAAFGLADPAVVAAFVGFLRDFMLLNNSELHVPTAPPPAGLSRTRMSLFVNAEGMYWVVQVHDLFYMTTNLSRSLSREMYIYSCSLKQSQYICTCGEKDGPEKTEGNFFKFCRSKQ